MKKGRTRRVTCADEKIVVIGGPGLIGSKLVATITQASHA
jgi:hypothetical protein